MVKKLLALAAATCLALSLAACGSSGTSLPSLTLPGSESSVVSGGEASEASALEPVADTDFSDDLEGLCQFMEANYAVTGEKEEMSYQEIGAIGGFRYLFTYAGSSLQVEFYQFDLENLDEKAQACLDSVKAQGTFTVLDNQVPAVLSDNGRYLMIYTDAGDSEESTAQRQRVEELFRGFKA